MNIKEGIQRTVEGSDLSKNNASEIMREILTGKATPAQFGSFVTALRVKGETPEEIAGRVEQAIEFVDPQRITLHPDCGFAPGSAAEIPVDEAYQKICNEVLAAEILRSRHNK